MHTPSLYSWGKCYLKFYFCMILSFMEIVPLCNINIIYLHIFLICLFISHYISNIIITWRDGHSFSLLYNNPCLKYHNLFFLLLVDTWTFLDFIHSIVLGNSIQSWWAQATMPVWNVPGSRASESCNFETNGQLFYKRPSQRVLPSWRPALPAGAWGGWGNLPCSAFGASLLLHFTQLYGSEKNTTWISCFFLLQVSRGKALFRDRIAYWPIYQACYKEGKNVWTSRHLTIPTCPTHRRGPTRNFLRSKWKALGMVKGISLHLVLR
jgi:hypothetical protein